MEVLFIKPLAILGMFLINAWMLKSYLAHRETMRRLSLAQERQAISDQRLERVEQTVESIAIEVERISEGQRFVTKLLAEPAPRRNAIIPVSGADTPH